MHNIIRNTALTIALGVLLLSGHEANAEMAVTGPTSQPVGHYEFCKIYPQDCTQDAPFMRSVISFVPCGSTTGRWVS